MDRRRFAAGAGATLLAFATAADAQPTRAPRRIALLSAFARADIDLFVGLLRVELAKLGWQDGRTVVLLPVRTSEGRNDQLPALAREVVAEQPDIVLVQSAPATRAAMQATSTIPIVMVGVGNPIDYGMVADYGKPGGNVTGSSYLADESTLKTLELLREAMPGVRSVALFANPTNEAAAPMVKRFRAAAESHRLRVQVLDVSKPADVDAAFPAIVAQRTEAILLPPEPLIRSRRAAIGSFAHASRIALVVVGSSVYLPPGALMSYGPTTAQYAGLTARYVDRILNGAKPGELAVEQPSRFELVIDLAAAHAIGVTVPDGLLQRADEVRR